MDMVERQEKVFFEKTGMKFPKCPICDTPMKFRWSKIYQRPGRNDQFWKCSNCFNVQVFGLPITEKEYQKEFELRGNNEFFGPDTRPDLVKRLEELGYLWL